MSHSYLDTAIKCFEKQSTIAYAHVVDSEDYDKFYIPHYDVFSGEKFSFSMFSDENVKKELLESCINFCLILAAMHGEI